MRWWRKPAASTTPPSDMRSFHKAEAILNEEAALLPVYYYVSTDLIKPYVKGWKPNISARHLSRYMYILAHQES